MKKILVTGFPHCGTTILKSKVGECQNVYEQFDEDEWPYPNEIEKYLNSGKEYLLWKDAVLRDDLKQVALGNIKKEDTRYRDTKIIVILRNPYYVFTSQKNRGLDPFHTPRHTINDYIITCEWFLRIKENNPENVFCIKYEEMFENNFQKLKKVFDSVGLIYSDDIFENKNKIYSNKKYYSEFYKNEKTDFINTSEYEAAMKLLDEQGIKIRETKGNIIEDGHLKPGITELDIPLDYRTWQVNQEFKNFNERPEKKIDISSELENILKNSDVIRKMGYNS